MEKTEMESLHDYIDTLESRIKELEHGLWDAINTQIDSSKYEKFMNLLQKNNSNPD